MSFSSFVLSFFFLKSFSPVDEEEEGQEEGEE